MGADVLRKEKFMQLLIKQRVFSWTDTYDVYDEKEEPKYFVKAEFFALGHQIHVYDKAGNEVGMVKQRLLPCFRHSISRSTEKNSEACRRSFPSLNRGMNLIITAGGVRAISWHGITMYMRSAVRWSIFQRSRSIGATPM